MADTKNAADITVVTVPAKVLSEIIGVGDRQVRNLAEEGILVRNSHGRYLLLKSVKNYIMNLKIAKAGEHVESDYSKGDLDLDQEKARHEHLKTMITEINLQLIKGQVHRSEEVGMVITDMFTKFRSKMMALPSKMARKLQGKSKEEIEGLLREEIAGALRELADYNPADYYSDEHIAFDEDNLLGYEDGGEAERDGRKE